MLETRQERTELMKTGIDGKEVEELYVRGNDIKIVKGNLLFDGGERWDVRYERREVRGEYLRVEYLRVEKLFLLSNFAGCGEI